MNAEEVAENTGECEKFEDKGMAMKIVKFEVQGEWIRV
jgi:hypothetical protein